MSAFRKNPAVRFWARTLAVAVLAAVAQGIIDGVAWDVLLRGAEVGAAYAVLGLLTPLEPFVGPAKVAVEVPADKATITRARPESTR